MDVCVSSGSNDRWVSAMLNKECELGCIRCNRGEISAGGELCKSLCGKEEEEG